MFLSNVIIFENNWKENSGRRKMEYIGKEEGYGKGVGGKSKFWTKPATVSVCVNITHLWPRIIFFNIGPNNPQ